MGWRQRGIGTGLAGVARVAAAPLVLALALAALPARTRSAASSTAALRERAAAVAGSPDGVAVEASLAALLSNPALGRRLDDALGLGTLDASTRDLLRAARTISRSSSALAGRLLGTPSTRVDRERLAQLAGDLGANPAVARLRASGLALQRQPWPTQVAIDRARTTLAQPVDATTVNGNHIDDGHDVAALLRGVETTNAFRATAGALDRVLDDPGAAGYVRTLPPVVAAGFLDGPALTALGRLVTGHSSRADDEDARAAAALVILASALLDGSPDVIATAITLAPTIA